MDGDNGFVLLEDVVFEETVVVVVIFEVVVDVLGVTVGAFVEVVTLFCIISGNACGCGKAVT